MAIHRPSPAVIRLAVMLYVKFPLSLRNVEDLLHERGIDLSYETVRHWWNRFGPMFAAEIRRKLVDRMRAFTHWRWRLWAKTNMAPLRRWCQRGARLKAKAPFGRWKTMTFIAALRCDPIDAPCLFDGPINGDAFLAYVQTFLVPTLKEGDVVIMDNLGSHRGKAVRKAIERRVPGCSSCQSTPPT
jgi:hypothetical protein